MAIWIKDRDDGTGTEPAFDDKVPTWAYMDDKNDRIIPSDIRDRCQKSVCLIFPDSLLKGGFKPRTMGEAFTKGEYDEPGGNYKGEKLALPLAGLPVIWEGSSGTGWLRRDGKVVTAFHVIETISGIGKKIDLSSVRVAFDYRFGKGGGLMAPTIYKVTGMDSKNGEDWAALTLESPAKRETLEVATDAEIRAALTGARLAIGGHPGGLPLAYAGGKLKQQWQGQPTIQVWVNEIRGMSGAPVFLLKQPGAGKVAGLLSFGSSPEYIQLRPQLEYGLISFHIQGNTSNEKLTPAKLFR